jgi:tetratricopeptide (TPR) repeat protein
MKDQPDATERSQVPGPDDVGETVKRIDWPMDQPSESEAVLIGGATCDTSFSLAESAPAPGGGSGPRVAGYEILEVVGRGAMGVVYKARQQSLKRVVALKMIRAGDHADEAEIRRFRTEAEAVGRLQHQNIVQVYDVAEHQGYPYLALEYIGGGSLQKRIAGMPQPLQAAAQLVQVLAQAIDFAHRQGIIHRDLKPANVLLTSPHPGVSQDSTLSHAPLAEQAYGTPKISDFGLAKKLEEDGGQTRSGTILGTPSYMAPEQASGRTGTVGPLADQYALGAMLYELLTGRPPFRGATVWETLEQVRSQEPVPPSRLQPKVPADLETICLKALQKEPHNRYDSAAALAEDLRRFVAGEPILARPIPWWERGWRWCRRNPKLAAMAAAVFALLLTVAGVSTWSAISLQAEQDETRRQRDRAEANAQLAEEKSRAADESARVAEHQSSLILDTLGKLATTVADGLKDRPGTEQVRAEVIQLTLDRVKQVEESAKHVKRLQRIEGGALMQDAQLLYSSGRPAEAKEAWQRGHNLLRAQLHANPDSNLAKGNVAAALSIPGSWALAAGNKAAARTYFEEGLQLWIDIGNHLERGELTLPEVKRSLWSFESNVAQALPPGPERDRHLSAATKALEEWLAVVPNNPEAKSAQAVAWYKQADERFGQGDLAAARARVLKIREELFDPRSGKLGALRELVRALLQNGELELMGRQDTPAREHYARARTLLKAPALLQPEFRSLLMRANYGLGTAERRLNGTVKARPFFEESLAYRKEVYLRNKNSSSAQINYLIGLASCGMCAEADAVAEKLLKSFPNNGDVFYQLGCGNALCAGAVAQGRPPAPLSEADRARIDTYRKKAVAALQAAVAKGFAVHMLQMDPDLDAIQDSPELIQLATGKKGN